jgi:hypothetical protein
MFKEASRRFQMAGIAGLISGNETPEDKTRGGIATMAVFLPLLVFESFFVALAGLVIANVLWGLAILYLKRRAGVSIDSIDY